MTIQEILSDNTLTSEEKLAKINELKPDESLARMQSEVDKQKQIISDRNSEAARYKKQVEDLTKERNEKLSAEEQEKLAMEEKIKSLTENLASVQKENETNKGISIINGLGITTERSGKIVDAVFSKDFSLLATELQGFIDEHDRSQKATLLGKTVQPGGGSQPKGMTREEFQKLSVSERAAYSNEHPDEYKELYKEE